MLDTFSPDVLLRQLIGALFFPPLNTLIPIVLALVLRQKWPRSCKAVLGLAIFATYLQTTPWLAMALNRPLESRHAIAKLEQVRHTQAIVVLGGGKQRAPEYAANVPTDNAYARLRYGAYLARTTGLPLLVSGGAPIPGEAEATVMTRALQQEYGITPRWIEVKSETTADNAVFSAAMLHAANVDRITLVTQAWHMPRAVRVFKDVDLNVLAAPTGFTLYDGFALQHWIPAGSASAEVYRAEREWLGLLYYQLRDLLQKDSR